MDDMQNKIEGLIEDRENEEDKYEEIDDLKEQV